MQAFWAFRVVAICGTQGTNGIDVVKDSVKLRYVEGFSNSKANENFLVLMKCFQAVFERVERGGGVGLEL